MTSKNPHMYLSSLTSGGALFSPAEMRARLWRCAYCKDVGTLEALRSRACIYVHSPCEVCGQTPECAPDCAGVLAILGAPEVHVVGGEAAGIKKLEPT